MEKVSSFLAGIGVAGGAALVLYSVKKAFNSLLEDLSVIDEIEKEDEEDAPLYKARTKSKIKNADSYNSFVTVTTAHDYSIHTSNESFNFNIGIVGEITNVEKKVDHKTNENYYCITMVDINSIAYPHFCYYDYDPKIVDKLNEASSTGNQIIMYIKYILYTDKGDNVFIKDIMYDKNKYSREKMYDDHSNRKRTYHSDRDEDGNLSDQDFSDTHEEDFSNNTVEEDNSPKYTIGTEVPLETPENAPMANPDNYENFRVLLNICLKQNYYSARNGMYVRIKNQVKGAITSIYDHGDNEDEYTCTIGINVMDNYGIKNNMKIKTITINREWHEKIKDYAMEKRSVFLEGTLFDLEKDGKCSLFLESEPRLM